MTFTNDILSQLDTSEINELKEFYSNHKNKYPHIYSFLKTTLKWRKTRPEYIAVFAVRHDWKTDGTFIALLTFSCYDIILHSFEESGEKLFQGLSETKQIDWHRNEILFYATHERFKPIIYQALHAINVTVKGASVTHLWQLQQNKALQITDEFEHENFYIDEIKPEDAEAINEVWPPRYDSSLEYLRSFIVMNGGYGIYEKGTDKLASWILWNVMGQLGVLQTKEEYLKKGLGFAVARKLTKCVAQNGDHVVGTVHAGNLSSEMLFSKLGFEKKYACIYIRCNTKVENV